MKKSPKQPQQLSGWPDGYPNMVYFGKGHDGKWRWVIKHQNRPVAAGTRGYSSKTSAKRAFLSFLTHGYIVRG
jgi:uncharacterized protein YegP (UPF0339 family)